MGFIFFWGIIRGLHAVYCDWSLILSLSFNLLSIRLGIWVCWILVPFEMPDRASFSADLYFLSPVAELLVRTMWFNLLIWLIRLSMPYFITSYSILWQSPSAGDLSSPWSLHSFQSKTCELSLALSNIKSSELVVEQALTVHGIVLLKLRLF